MALAQRLNELAIANSQGLLDDDEYRLLRQSVFEEHAANVIPTPTHLRSKPRQTKPPQPPPPPAPAPPPRSKSSLGVVGLLRRATGRKPAPAPIPTHKAAGSSSGSTLPLVAATPVPPSPKRTPLLPRLLSKRTAEPPAPPQTTTPVVARTRRDHTPIAIVYPPPASSPSSSNFSGITGPHYPPGPAAAPPDVFDDDHLVSSRAIRAAITATEDEARRLADAFDALEAATLRRVQKQRARRLPASTPASVAVLLEGREWREHRLPPSTSVPHLRRYPSSSGHAHHASAGSTSRTRAASDAGSDHGSARTPRSSTTPVPTPPVSPARGLAATLRRKASLSSISSFAPSLTPSSSAQQPPQSLLARSTSHLGLRRLMRAPRSAAASTETLGLPPHAEATPTRPYLSPNPNSHSHSQSSSHSHSQPHPHRHLHAAAAAVEDDPELADIRRRRDALVARYNARADFLRAKLKGAELHEKLLRK